MGIREEARGREPFAFYRDDRRKRVYIKITDELDRDVWATALARQIDEGVWHYGTLFDLEDASTFPLFAEIDRIRWDIHEIDAERGGRGPVALVLPESIVQAGRERFKEYEGLVPFAFQVFTDYGAADAWLDEVTR